MTAKEAVKIFKLSKEQGLILEDWESEMLELNPVYTVTKREIGRLKNGELEKRLSERKLENDANKRTKKTTTRKRKR